MQIFEVKHDASRELKEKVARLFMQQISVDDSEDSFKHAMDAIELTLSPHSSSRVIIAENNGEIYGLAFLNIGISLRLGGPYLWLNELFVHDELRNLGIGKKLLLYIIHLAENEGIRSIELETGVNNSVTKHIYNSLGFYEVVSNRYGFTF
jgi:GNAT superfamily N-acetyltransferase